MNNPIHVLLLSALFLVTAVSTNSSLGASNTASVDIPVISQEPQLDDFTGMQPASNAIRNTTRSLIKCFIFSFFILMDSIVQVVLRSLVQRHPADLSNRFLRSRSHGEPGPDRQRGKHK